MTDKEIEKALEVCGRVDAPTAVYPDCSDCPYKNDRNCAVDKNSDTLAYITRLKAENEDLYAKMTNLQTYIDNHEEIWKHNAEIEKAKARKDTAKEILQAIDQKCGDLVADNSPESLDFLDFARDTLLTELCNKYGVEVDDD